MTQAAPGEKRNISSLTGIGSQQAMKVSKGGKLNRPALRSRDISESLPDIKKHHPQLQTVTSHI